MSILTPETNPDHHTIGKYFKGHGCLYYCDSYDTAIGYWMTPVFGEKYAGENSTPERTNVSERAINRTFHEIWDIGTLDEPRYECRHRLTPEERVFMTDTLAPPSMIAVPSQRQPQGPSYP